MHTITHEYRHKGQIAAMLRQMGYEPPKYRYFRNRR
ncbi:DinB family protein [Bacillus sp. JJ1609]